MNCVFFDLRAALSTLAILLLIPEARAAVEVVEDAEGQQGLTVHRMTVTHAAEPVPALKHRFRVPMHQRRPGNAATHYLRSLGEGQGPLRLWRRLEEIHGDVIHEWYDYAFPRDEIPMPEFREVARAFRSYVDQFIRDATSCRRCDWGLEEMDLRGPETIAYLLPDAQESRSASRGLAVLARLATIESRHEDALDYIRMNYQLGQDISKQRFLVCALVGMAEVGIANKSVIELIGSPDSPNMYWALSELPRPVIEMREAMNLEMSLGLRMFPVLLDVEEKNHTPEEWSRLFTETIQSLDSSLEILGSSRLPEHETLAQLGATGLSLLAYPGAKQRLIASGKSPAEVKAMAVAQVLLIDTAREFQKTADDFEKWTFVPYRDMRSPDLRSAKITDGYGKLLAQLLLPAVTAARTAQMRMQWQIDALRTIEALRMHVAEVGSFPESLDQIYVVPVPKNPLTGQQYLYRLEDETAVLELPFSDGMPGAAWRFELKLATK